MSMQTNIPLAETQMGQPPKSMGEFNPGISQESESALKSLEASIAQMQQGKAALPPAPVQPVPQPIVAVSPAPVPVVPPQPPQAPAQVQPVPPVPPKFQNPDGTPNMERVEKSTVNAMEALERYKQIERELSQKRQQVAGFQNYPPPAPFAPQYPYGPNGYAPYAQPAPYVDPHAAFHARVQHDLQTDPAGTLIRMHQAAIEASRFQAVQETQDVKRQTELMHIAQSDPSIFTPERMARLQAIREQRPYLDQSPTPWLDAYQLDRGMAPQPVFAPPAPQAAARPSAPIIAGGQAPSVPVPEAPLPTTQAELDQHLNAKFGHLPETQRIAEKEKYLAQVLQRAGAYQA